MRRSIVTAFLFAFLATASLATPSHAADPQIEFELLTEPGFPQTASRAWIEVLKDFKPASLRIRSGRQGEQADVKELGNKFAPRYKVIGLLTPANRLIVPGGSFSVRDRGQIAGWVRNLKNNGAEATTEGTGAFGLTAKELVALHEKLAKPVRFSTQGEHPVDVVRSVVKGLPLTFTVDPASRTAFAEADPVVEELNGLSSGTVLACVLRPLGLALAPQKSQGQVQLAITDFRRVPEAWPVGWPSQKPAKDLMPKLFTFLNVEIDDTPLADALTALEERLEVPFLYDHNSLVRQDIDPATTKVSVPSGNSFYKKILDRLLFQAKLRSEVRVDEAKKPFLWISTAKR